MGNTEPAAVGDEGDIVGRCYRSLSGTVVSDPVFISRLGHAAYLTRLVYNATIDRHVPFAVGLAYRLTLGDARRNSAAPPPEPARSSAFLPAPNRFALGPELTALCERFPVLRAVPRSMLDNALDEGCRARRRHLKDCAEAKANGRSQPRLSFRRADDPWSVTTDNFWLLRIGTDHAQPPPKKRRVSAATKKNRARRARRIKRREAAWAEEKRRCGWNEDKVAAGLARRAERQRRDRERQQAREAELANILRERRVRRDSPKATRGERRMKVDIDGLGRFRIDLGDDISEDARKVRITLRKPAWRGAKVEVKVVFSVSETKREHDPVQTGIRLHESLRHLPDDASPMDAYEAALAAGILVRGQDLGSRNPSCDDTGMATRPVRTPRADIAEMKRRQKSLSHKDECGKKEDARTRTEAARAAKAADEIARAGTGKKRRSNRAEKERAAIQRISERGSNRSETRAHQDVALLLRDGPLLVATDPKRMVPPLLAKDGPAERRARREAGFPVPALRGMGREEKMARGMRRNLHATRFALRVDVLADKAAASGTILCTPGHEGTTSTCPRCRQVERKGLGERWHRCPCGLTLPRDQASAIETVGRALLPFRTSADPGGMIAAAESARAADRLKAEEKRRKLSERSRASAGRRRLKKAGDPPGDQVVVSPGPPEATQKRARAAGRNVRKAGPRAGSN